MTVPRDDVPSAGWRAVYAALGASTDVEDDRRDCPDCGRDAPRVGAGVYWCPDHGAWETAAG